MVSTKRIAEAQRKHNEAMSRFYKANPNPVCSVCRKPIPEPTKAQRDQWWRRGTLICSRECALLAKKTSKRKAYKKKMEASYPNGVPCSTCGKPIAYEEMGKSQRTTFYRTGRVYCSMECTKKAQTSALLKAKKSMTHAQKIEQAKTKAKVFVEKNIHMNKKQFQIQRLVGGELEYVVDLGDTYAQIDVAFPEKKIGIEIDESHHGSKRQQKADTLRDEKLSQLGWIIYRFSEKEPVEKILSIALK